jgi:transposase-like protein
MGTRKRRRYTAQERSEAVAKAGELGLTAAAKALGMSKTNIWRWLKQSEGAADAAAAAEATAAPSAAVVDDVAEQSAVKSGRVRPVYTPSERARILEHAAKHGPTAAAKKYGCTRWSIRDWKRKTKLHAEGKSAASPVVGSDDDPAVERDRRILAVWRKHRGLGPSQIKNQLRRAGLKISTHTVRVTMEEHGYVPPKSRRKEVHDERYEAIRPNMMWHADFLHRYVNKLKVYVLLFIDDHSRFIVGWGLWEGERVASVIHTFEEAVARFGRPESMLVTAAAASGPGGASAASRSASRSTRWTS